MCRCAPEEPFLNKKFRCRALAYVGVALALLTGSYPAPAADPSAPVALAPAGAFIGSTEKTRLRDPYWPSMTYRCHKAVCKEVCK